MSHFAVQGQDGDGKPYPPTFAKNTLLTVFHFKLDAGMHPGYDGLAALPFYDDFDLSTVDVLLISQ